MRSQSIDSLLSSVCLLVDVQDPALAMAVHTRQNKLWFSNSKCKQVL